MKYPLLFLHIPRTGGTTLRDIVINQYTSKNVLEVKRFKDVVEFNEKPEIYHGKQVVIGHFQYGIHHYLNSEPSYITFLRDPIKRVISTYTYARGNKKHKDHLFAENNSIDHYIMSGRNHMINNGITKLIAGEWDNESIEYGSNPAWLLEKAQKHLDEHFLLVGITEHFNSSIVILSELLKWKIPYYSLANRSKRKRMGIPMNQTTHNNIKELNHLDFKLYELYSDKLIKTIEASPALLHRINLFTNKNRTHGKVQIGRRLNRLLSRLRKQIG